MDEIPHKRGRGRPKAWADTTDQNTIKSLDRALEILMALGNTQGATLSEIAQSTGQSAATVYRVLVTFQGKGFVDFNDNSQLWNIGAEAFVTGAKFLRRTSLVDRARPIMRALMEATGETANLGVEQDGKVLFVSQVETHATIRAFFPPGTVAPMHSSGIGKAILAHLPEQSRAAIMAKTEFTKFTPKTLSAPAALQQDLSRIVARGYSFDDEERNMGMRCIAAPVYDAYGEVVAGLSVSGPTARMTDVEITAFSKPVIAAAAELSDAIGGQRRD